ncbi:Dyp-type peroxidase [Rhodococcus sp. HNM0569]|uniref:Dyp-type peroxidase n=1 Tax=Rhodococcus sp. HNM0569 TaxID=2716340 RepID=UPI00146DD652|nr:Dyp-type peroxidase [Rhodococcus sp. HNM0569]NLU83203.1 Dyp-type peroxidase [Rhodococcus sp. HNM0569]
MTESLSAQSPQKVSDPLSAAALFVVVQAGPAAADAGAVLDVATGVGELVKNVGFRDLPSSLSCVVSIGSRFWDRLGLDFKPAGLHPFVPLDGGVHSAPSTPGDILFHIKARRPDLCFELGRQIVSQLGSAGTVVDEVHGFRYFDSRDLLGFVDGTANPVGAEAVDATTIGDAEPEFSGGSYVIVQKYLHDMAAWDSLTVEEQQNVIGRTKVENIELDDDVKPSNSHVALNTIVDDDGVEHDILRDNMPFGSLGDDEYGTYFIGYAKDVAITELMLQHMFLGNPEGNYDRILDFSTAVTGTLFFVPSLTMLGRLPDLASPSDAVPESGGTPTTSDPAPAPNATPADTSLGIGGKP